MSRVIAVDRGALADSAAEPGGVELERNGALGTGFHAFVPSAGGGAPAAGLDAEYFQNLIPRVCEHEGMGDAFTAVDFSEIKDGGFKTDGGTLRLVRDGGRRRIRTECDPSIQCE